MCVIVHGIWSKCPSAQRNSEPLEKKNSASASGFLKKKPVRVLGSLEDKISVLSVRKGAVLGLGSVRKPGYY